MLLAVFIMGVSSGCDFRPEYDFGPMQKAQIGSGQIDLSKSSTDYQAGSNVIIALLGDNKDVSMAAEYSLDFGDSWTWMDELQFSDGKARWLIDLPVLPEAIQVRLRAPASFAIAGTISLPLRNYDDELCGRYSISKVTETAEFAPRDGAGLVVYNDLMWISGGWNPAPNVFPTTTSNEVWLSASGLAWTKIKENSFTDASAFNSSADWEGRHLHGAVVHDNSMWIVGGDPLTGHYQNDIWRSEDGINWRLMADTTPWSDRTLHSVVAFQNQLWVLGGQTIPQFAGQEEEFYSDVWSSTDGVTWEKQPTGKPSWSARGSLGLVEFDDRLWLLGGGTYNTPNLARTHKNDVWNSGDGRSWNLELEAAPWVPRIFQSTANFDGRLWIFGGHGAGYNNLNDIWLSEDGNHWTQCPSPISARHAASMAVHNDELIIMMGAGREVMNDVWKISLRH